MEEILEEVSEVVTTGSLTDHLLIIIAILLFMIFIRGK